MSPFQKLKTRLEHHQSALYGIMMMMALVIACLKPQTSCLEAFMKPALGIMLYVTFLQLPLMDMRRGFTQLRFLGALLTANFVVIPLFVAFLARFLPDDRMVKLGVLIVLLCPCIDYVVTFAYMGRANAGRLLSAVPLLLVVQMLLLPFYLRLIMGARSAGIVHSGPFIDALIWLIIVPLALAALTQMMIARRVISPQVASFLSLMPVPATSGVLFIIIAAMVPHLGGTWRVAWCVAPFFVLFSVMGPWIGWITARLWRLDILSGRAVAFSAGTRNALVVLPLALAVSGNTPIMQAVIVTQIVIELVSLFFYTRLISQWGAMRAR